MSTAGAYSFSYDAAGNMTAGNGTTFSYDAANRLKGAGGVSNQYGYDGDGNRVRQPGLYYVWSSVLDKVAFEVDASANVQRAFVYLGSEVIALQSTDGGFYWAHTDHLSSGRMLTNTAGAVVYRGDFDPFGQVAYEWSASGNVNLNTRKFTGYERDATGLDYARARGYTSSWGRFIQADPLGSGHQGQKPNPLGAAKQDGPQTLNRYGYVSNDPVNFDDPSGLLRRLPGDGCICCGDDTGGGVGVTASGTSQAIYKPDFCTISSMSPPTFYCEFVPISGCSLTCMPSKIVRRLTKAPDANYRIIRLQVWAEAFGTRICTPGAAKEVDAPFGTSLTCAELP